MSRRWTAHFCECCMKVILNPVLSRKKPTKHIGNKIFIKAIDRIIIWYYYKYNILNI